MNITFIGNCQTIALCFLFQELLHSDEDYYVCWIMYGEDFNRFIGDWTNKCKNKILTYDNAIQQLIKSDIVIYQNVCKSKSLFCNTENILEIVNKNCKMIHISSMHLDYSCYEDSLKDLQRREENLNVNFKVSNIIEKFKNKKLFLSKWHPNTFLFLNIVKELCIIINIEFFTDEDYNNLLKNDNIVELPELQ